ncbi:ATP-binding cassette domain-containing protein [Kiloniella antarctica]|uniref:ATP-binding cassette domain-containing protein n=1 Tax=Kiloniella antarctica TaxID=1550907 RepID=A0ABW5BM59_9PROT
MPGDNKNKLNTYHRADAPRHPVPLVLKEFSLKLREKFLFSNLNLIIKPGEIATLMGPSGCGKSSLLAAISGTLSSEFSISGNICLGDFDLTPLPPEQRHIGMLFQEDLLFPHMSVGENLSFGIPPSVKGRKARAQLINQALEDAGLPDFSNRDPATLSGGQRARIAVLRTLLSQPTALLLDEPFSRLDVALRERFRAFVFRHAKAHQLPTLLVTHDPDDASSTEGTVLNMVDINN